jgi:hypothetical protein
MFLLLIVLPAPPAANTSNRFWELVDVARNFYHFQVTRKNKVVIEK